ncbi:hypothetical protein FRX31_024566 [Thalictrum thalictroides]|uniref:Reverse transcriptase zinc-binding domain-containing protein n=1 Tax=Thalictrum thalictroides TaxID=46969 RepID=A0A7J6VL36_THATH|nr:hypothetical protein FRX31_024566 [Thalictrum thalictroides]
MVILETVMINDEEDRWRWKGQHGGDFSVAAFYEDLTKENGTENFPSQIVWKVSVPYKVKVFMWCLIWGRLLTTDRLRRLGMIIPNRCTLCKIEEETVEHLFQTCSFTKLVWEAFLNGVGMDGSRYQVTGEIQQWLQGWPKLNSSRWGTVVWQLTPYAVLWTVWKSKNNVIFNDESLTAEKVVVRAKAIIWYWCLGKEVRRGHRFSELLHNWVSVVKGVG